MEINQIQIKHPILGEILINTSIYDFIHERIGDVIPDYSKELEYYHAEVKTEDKEKFTIKNLYRISPEAINVGFMQNKKGNKNFITVITNRKASEDLDIYSSSVLSVAYYN